MLGFSDLVRSDVPLVTAATAVYPYDAAIEQRYRFTSRFDDEVLLHEVEGDRIHLPRELCPIGQLDRRDAGEEVMFPACPTPKPDQQAWFAQTVSFLEAGQSGIVVAGTGRGKTVCGYYAAYHVRRKTLVVTTKDDIYRQWLEGAERFLGLAPAEIGQIRQGKCEVIGTKFVVAMIHSLSKPGKYPEWIRHGFGLVIFDECHRLPADQFRAVASMFPARLRLGLSATPERADGKELLVYAHGGPVRVEAGTQLLVPKVLRYRTGWVCPRREVWSPAAQETVIERIPHEAGQSTHVEKILAADGERNARLAQLIHVAWQKGRRIVVFSTLLAHLEAMAKATRKWSVPEAEIGFYAAAQTKAEKAARDKVKARSVIFTTYTMMGEGTDIPWLDTCVLAMPRSRVAQPIGRIRREHPDKADPVVLDLIDADSPLFRAYAARRRAWYAEIGAMVKDMT